ncbi:LPS export ABC transporter permease LptG [Caulobacter sp. Root655]|uniref:LPS export ABC transporter permease LptG n=1 Tax=Caulobacter sp. Root655 TaxID=1736578 RepID=UPI0006F3F7D2|nr:LPS export ABC transporter permease LptG [Caulobacter sp. Root655]KRA60271.1 LPS export ABC transporter permease LptG [Caulobacter sp. Root655]
MIAVGMIERYVLKKTLASLAAALAVVAVLVMLIAFVDISKNVGTRTEVGFSELLFLTVLQAPATILVLTPFIFLFGTLGAFVGLNRRSELIAMRAAGVSAWRFIMPAAIAAFIMGLLTVSLLNPLTAAMSAQFETSRNAMMENYLKSAPKGLWLRQGDEKTQIVIRARARDQATDGTVRLRGVSLFIYAVGPNGSLQFSRRIEAAEARLEPGFWRLTGVREAMPGAGAIRSEGMSIRSDLDDRTASERFNNPQAIAIWRLPETIKRTDAAGFSSIPFRLRLHQVLATPLLFAAMSVLAAAFSLRLMRLGGLAGLAGAGVTLGFGFFFFNELCGALGKADVLTPAMAAWTPPVVALLAGLTLLCYTEDG